jgi:hypothetical protein
MLVIKMMIFIIGIVGIFVIFSSRILTVIIIRGRDVG